MCRNRTTPLQCQALQYRTKTSTCLFAPVVLSCVLLPKVQVAQAAFQQPLRRALHHKSTEEDEVCKTVPVSPLRRAQDLFSGVRRSGRSGLLRPGRLIASFVRGFGCHVAGSRRAVAGDGCGSSFAVQQPKGSKPGLVKWIPLPTLPAQPKPLEPALLLSPKLWHLLDREEDGDGFRPVSSETQHRREAAKMRLHFGASPFCVLQNLLPELGLERLKH